MATLESDRRGELVDVSGESVSELFMLGKQHQQMLLILARGAIASHLEKGSIPALETEDPELLRPAGVFVTLRTIEPPTALGDDAFTILPQGRLRGCVGRIVADQPLVRAVQEMAVRSATRDPRFPPLEQVELEHVRLEISILSPLHLVSSLQQVLVGKNGLVIEEGSHRAVLLPKVATAMGWNRQQFLENLCRKADLPLDAWPGTASLFAFTSLDFAEAD
jgi:AmmeMemoRadiSam system protein A